MSGIESPSRTSSHQSSATTGDNAYPEQKHAGAVGYGPEYGKGASIGDKIDGVKEELKGKILRKPDLVEHGKELRTGQLKKQQMEDDANPFAKPGEDEGKPGTVDKQEEVQAATTAPEGTAKAHRQATGQNADKIAHP